jgi:hypothetical protein
METMDRSFTVNFVGMGTALWYDLLPHVHESGHDLLASKTAEYFLTTRMTQGRPITVELL